MKSLFLSVMNKAGWVALAAEIAENVVLTCAGSLHGEEYKQRATVLPGVDVSLRRPSSPLKNAGVALRAGLVLNEEDGGETYQEDTTPAVR